VTWSPRLVATDLDGTIVRSDACISPRTLSVLARIETADVPFVMVTGRPPRWMAQVADQTNHRGLAICANGALLYDLHTEQVVQSHLLDAAAAEQVVAALRQAVPGIAFAVERGPADGKPGGFAREPHYVPKWEQEDLQVLATDDELFATGAVKLLARHRELDSDALLAAARTALIGMAETTHSSADGLIEISAVGISKASGLAAFCEQQGVAAADVVAFGDMPNDLPMLAWAGYSVAMGNGHPDVREAADEVTGHVDDDGVAQVLERWF